MLTWYPASLKSGSSTRPIFFFIDLRSYFPVSGTDYPDYPIWAMGVTDKQNTVAHLAEKPPSKLVAAPWAMRLIERDDGMCITERLCGF
jgi:hypothetical protein